ncbi:BTAD domain-containing putative transcriptional regulator [Nonomuraea sp. NPDC050663]|uniref:AfsR/SARP family transcriptional regulator n=1 Tax=Nonomuraea sp. NPDC050663 TaxID=3364370 RepID=UPI00378EFE9A
MEILLADHPVRLGGERQRKLLAILLLHPGMVISFDQLIDELWDDPPPTARRQVFNAGSALRRLVAEQGGPADIFQTTTAGYLISPAEGELDAARFQEDVKAADREALGGRHDEAIRLLQRALAQWRGPTLSGLRSRLIDSGAAALDEQRIAAVERLYTIRLESGDGAALVSELVRLVADHPLRERLRCSLMMALARSGRQADALAVYDEGRRHLAEELGLDPSAEMRHLHERLLRGESEPAIAVTAPTGTAPSFLPNDSLDFTGRAAELRHLVAEAGRASAAPAIVVISGMGGVGKTALAVHLAHQVAAGYPDGQFFLDLRGFTTGGTPVAPGEGLESLLCQYGLPAEQIPADTDARAAQWRKALAGKKALVILDNALDATQVRPLLPGSPGTLVLVTSRQQVLALEDAIPFSLGSLAPNAADELFRRIAGPASANIERDAVRRVTSLCGGLPLAVRIAASRLRQRPTWTVAHLAELMRDRRKRRRVLSVSDRGVADVLSLSYQHLTDVQQRVFRLLGLHQGSDFDARTGAAIAGITLEDAEDALEELVECNLLMQRSPGRYRFHDLVRDCAHELAEITEEPSRLRAARHRMLDYYLALAHAHCHPIALGYARFDPDLTYPPMSLEAPASTTEAIEVLRIEHANLLAAIHLADQQGWDVHAWQLPCLLLPYFAHINHRAGSANLFHIALRAARAQGSLRGESAALANLALAYRDRGRRAEVEELFQQAIRLSRELGDTAAEAWQHCDLGVSHLQAGRVRDAYNSFTTARTLAVAAGDRSAEMTSVGNLGLVCSELGQYDEASDHFLTALAEHRRSGRQDFEVMMLVNLGWVAYLRNRFEESVSHLSQGLELSREIRYVRGEAMTLAWLCTAQRCLGALDDAIKSGQEALPLAYDADLRETECDALAALGESFLAVGDVQAAESLFRRALRVACDNDLPFSQARAEEGLAHTAARHGDLIRARRHWERAIEIFPDDAVEATNALRHLTRLDADAWCLRCVTRPRNPHEEPPAQGH